MNQYEEIKNCLTQAIQQRTTTEIVATLGTKTLTLQNFQQLIKKYNRNIINKEVEDYYYKVLAEHDSKIGISQEILEKVVEKLEKPKQRKDVVMSLIEGIQSKKVTLERIFKYFDYDGDGKMSLNELREMLEYLHPYITEEDIRILKKNNDQVQFTFENVKTLISFEQNMNAELVIVNDEESIDDEQEEDYDEYGQFKGDQDEYFDEFEENEEIQQFEELYRQLKEKKELFTDTTFPPNQSSLGSITEQYEWKRLSEIWTNGQIFQKDLYHNDNQFGIYQLVSPRDIKQGYLGDCYFLSSLASIASKHPQKIFDLFITPKCNPQCIYCVELCIQGQWKFITLDDYVPVYNQEPAFCSSDCQELWVILLEKAWAKVFGNYGNIISGDPREVIASITGGPTWCISSDEPTFIEKLKPIMNSDYIVCAGTYHENSDYEKVGLIANHAYSILNFRTIILPNKQEVQLIKLKNPYGNGVEWNGPWSDNSELWTQELKDNVLKHQEQDGIFFMSIEDFKKYFDNVFVGYCNKYFNDYSLTVICQRSKSSYILVNIKKDGEFYFSAYQQSKRLNKMLNGSDSNYQYSDIRLALAKMNKNNQITFICAATEADMSFHIGGRLQKGQYILQIKANWIQEDWNTHDSVIVGYGEDEPEMKLCQNIPNFLQVLITQEAKDKKANSKQVHQQHQHLVVLKDRNSSFGVSYQFYQNTSKDHTYTFTLIIEGQIKLKKPLRGNEVEIELKPGQDKLIMYKALVTGQQKVKTQILHLKCKDFV